MERDVTIALFTIYFVCIFWGISSIIWFMYLTIRLYMVRAEIYKKISVLNNEVVFLQELSRENPEILVNGPPPYTQV
ncbi:small hydrophobic protein [Wenzhou Rattus norvegicus jeilongvirus 1]|uniref:Small hydrophobic protein n=1 Tax=Wenzhou Rattus norvegicus jeilongvirus 1 TaxID=2877485 RepID=A0AAE8XV50_9MONO|nr:small hydrophobic protein [Wenzhou Rattus norvegicus jeilongvirus 1]WPV62358.1 MAG: small hydrophobic protein [Jeilongvirus beilongi]WPV62376.1 MAG: small hydrophobic protein [Jeilongvirus beilongi]WPV62385.1 MAG: small hydrophobic protein [Jeilongvirus beilongi]